MQTICIQSTEIEYEPSDVITFDEGMIGLPQLRRMVLVSQPEISPFHWLASVDEPETAFLVLDPLTQYERYAPSIPEQTKARIGLAAGEKPLLLTIVRISAEWQESSINLKAPMVIAPGAMRGMQIVATEREYLVDEPLAIMQNAA
jgi:flagellar assembly factor FliW